MEKIMKNISKYVFFYKIIVEMYKNYPK